MDFSAKIPKKNFKDRSRKYIWTSRLNVALKMKGLPDELEGVIPSASPGNIMHFAMTLSQIIARMKLRRDLPPATGG